jgi:hypothetical protein
MVVIGAVTQGKAEILNVVAHLPHAGSEAVNGTIVVANSFRKVFVISRGKVTVEPVGRRLKEFVNTLTKRSQSRFVGRRVVEVPAHSGPIIRAPSNFQLNAQAHLALLAQSGAGVLNLRNWVFDKPRSKPFVTGNLRGGSGGCILTPLTDSKLSAARSGGLRMNKLTIDLQYCHGITKLKETFDFSKRNAYAIYAPNGSMKTSFATTFEELSKGEEPKDSLYPKRKSVCEVKDENKQDLAKEDIVVVLPTNLDSQGLVF